MQASQCGPQLSACVQPNLSLGLCRRLFGVKPRLKMAENEMAWLASQLQPADPSAAEAELCGLSGGS